MKTNNQRTFFESNDQVELSAPGINVLSTYPQEANTRGGMELRWQSLMFQRCSTGVEFVSLKKPIRRYEQHCDILLRTCWKMVGILDPVLV
jgi:hypothetical protein